MTVRRARINHITNYNFTYFIMSKNKVTYIKTDCVVVVRNVAHQCDMSVTTDDESHLMIVR